MDEAVIIQALEQACPGLDLYFQTILQQDALYIYINRPAAEKLNYEALSCALKQAIVDLALPEIQSLMLFSRVLGATDPDWQSPPLSLTESDITDEPEIVEAMSSLDELSNESEEVTVASQEDNPEAAEDASDSDDISQYCFIQNKALVTSDVLPPDGTITALVEAFHHLNHRDKCSILPRLAQFFKTQQVESQAEDSAELAEFSQKLLALKGAEVRKASIWISRYCNNPQKALDQSRGVPVSVQDTASSETSEPEAPVEDDPLQQYSSNVRQKPTQAVSSYDAHVATRQQKTAKPKFTWQLLLIPVLWTLFTLVSVCYSVQANHGTDAIARVCKNSKGQPEYCKLAVQLVGTDTYQTHSKQTTPIEPIALEKAAEDCMAQAVLNTGVNIRDLKEGKYDQTFKEAYKGGPPPYPTTQELSPALYVMDVTLIKPQDPTQNVRTACVVGTVENSMSNTQRPRLLASEPIPTQWPQEALKKKPAKVKVADAQSLHGILTLIGTNGLFAAIGLFLIMFLNLGIRIHTLNSLYLAALIFAGVETVINLVPMLGPFSLIRFTAVPVVGLMITSLFVKEMELDFSVGYKVLAMAGGILVGVRLLGNGLLLVTITSML
jgi:hypothetical protein